MKDQETQDSFIILRSQGKTLADISEQLNVSRGTLFNWNRKFRYDIRNLRSVVLEDLRAKLLASREVRATALCDELKRIQQEILKRDLADIPTARLYSIEEMLRRQVLEELGDTPLTGSSMPSLNDC